MRSSPPGRALRVGGVTRFTTIDYPGKLAAVVFVQGCPWRCSYCHNPHLQPRRAAGNGAQVAWADTLAWLRSRQGLLDAVVFSGGEPTLDASLPNAIADVRGLGFAVGLHTAGIYPRRLASVVASLDWIGLDVKAALHDGTRYDTITGVPGSSDAVRDAVQIVLDSGVPCEFRTTASPAWLGDDELLVLASTLARLGATSYALQAARPVGTASLPGGGAPPVNYPRAATLARLGSMFRHFVFRAD